MTDTPSPAQALTRTFALTGIAMFAFAANSILCRLALGDGSIDPATFGTVRVASGALVLALFMVPRWRSGASTPPQWRTIATLFFYVVCFSFAYVSLPAGTGALILFGAVQLTMFAVALRAGERFGTWAWFGLSVAMLGLIYLVIPGVAAPDPFGAGLMALAGISWGAYSLLGRSNTDPAAATAGNFIYCVPLVLIVSILFREEFQASRNGVMLGVASGAIASGLGYVIWYAALRGLSGTRAATVQLSVPALAAIGGVLLLSEALTARLIIASVATLGGVAIVLVQRRPT